MVMNLDKCIGCHTCSVTCKNVWTNRRGTEYMWFNDVETKPGVGYPKRWEDQEQWNGGWELDRRGKLRLKAGGRLAQAREPLLQPGPADARRLLRALDLRLRDADDRARAEAPAGRASRVAGDRASRSTCSGARTGRTTSPAPPSARRPTRTSATAPRSRCGSSTSRRSCSTSRASASTASTRPASPRARRARCTSARRTGSCSSTRTRAAAGACASAAAPTRRSTSTGRPARPRSARSATRGIEAGQPTICSETCVGRIRYLGVVLYDADRVEEAASVADEKDLLAGAALALPRPERPRGARAGRARRDRGRLARGRSPLAGVRARRRAPGRAAAPPRVPDAADGLVRAAALAGDEPDRGRGLRGRPRRRLPRDRRAADPDRVPREPAHRRRPGAGSRRAAAGSPRCGATCASGTSAASPIPRSPRPSG